MTYERVQTFFPVHAARWCIVAPMQLNPRFGPHLRLIGMAVLWGASWPAGRIIAQSMPPLAGASLRFLLAALVLIPWLYWAGGLQQLKNWSAQRWLCLLYTSDAADE